MSLSRRLDSTEAGVPAAARARVPQGCRLGAGGGGNVKARLKLSRAVHVEAKWLQWCGGGEGEGGAGHI